eukprot:GHVT01059355.1.p2 GENE.GHVT01059355.1~~GHVT01059355.1.p2  ORF type:complete len:139 (+),score=10.81 GHVT01059355.1:1645-2061(+)
MEKSTKNHMLSIESKRTRNRLFRTTTCASTSFTRGLAQTMPSILNHSILLYYILLAIIYLLPPQLLKMIAFVPTTQFVSTPFVHQVVVQKKFVVSHQQVLNYSRWESNTPVVLYTPFTQEKKIIMNMPCPCPVKVVKC